MKKTFGEFFRSLRKSNKMNLREFCRKHGFDHGNISRLERGLLKPPQDQENLEDYARALNMKPESSEWDQFFVLAAVENGKIPSQITENPALLERLPKVFNKVESRRPSWTTSTNLQIWADTLDARSRLPQLVRRLIHATVDSVEFVDFPAGEDVGRQGWDGIVRSEKGNAFVPSGQSCWEMGVDKDVKRKADKDFEKRKAETEDFDQKETVFVFVSPRKWTRKDEWVNEKKKLGIWKDVRVYDSSNLEQWLETAPVVDAWFARPDGVTEIEEHWENIKLLTLPTLKPEIFLTTREKNIETLKNWLSGSQSILEFEASSPDELFDFIAAYIASLDENERDNIKARRIVVVAAKEAWRTLIASDHPIVLIPKPSIAAEEELIVEALRRGHYVLLWKEVTNEPQKRDNRLSRVVRFELEKPLEASGFKKEEAKRIARESGGSPTVLKRHIAQMSIIKKPEWTSPDAALELIPILLAGGWNESHEWDRKIIEKLSGQSYERVEEIANKWQKGKDAPLMKALHDWRFVSRDDSWALLAQHITSTKLMQFEQIAVEVLREESPIYELPPEERWRAAIHNKTPKYSDQLRKGIAETLALLGAKPPAHLLTDLPSPEARVESVIIKLLSEDATWQLWASLADILPILAEASPDAFLKSIERDLDSNDPKVLRLFIKLTDPFLSSSPHPGLLWALETLAWDRQYLSRVSMLLIRLTDSVSDLKSGNNPMNSLVEIFLPWLPQTNVSAEERIKVLERLSMYKRYSEVGFQLLLNLLPTYHGTSHFTHRPLWREWSLNWSDRVPIKDYFLQVDACANMLLEIAEVDIGKWLQLIDKFENFPPSAQNRILNKLNEIDLRSLDSDAIQRIGETLREKVAKHRRYSDANWALPARIVEKVEEVQKRFETDDLLLKHKWLFEHYPDIPDQSPSDSIEKYEESLYNSRKNALMEILNIEGLPRIIELADVVVSPGGIGFVLANANMLKNDHEVIPQLLSSENKNVTEMARGYVLGCFRRGDRDNWDWVYGMPLNTWTVEQAARYLVSLNHFERKTWDLVSALGTNVSDLYWDNAGGFCREPISEDVEYSVSKLLDRKRPAQALFVLNMALFNKCDLNSSIIMKTLEVALDHLEEVISGHTGFEVKQMFKKLQSDPEIDVTRLARLEWNYLQLLDGHDVSPKTLQNSLRFNPDFFASIVSWIYRSSKEHPDSRKIPTDEQKRVASNAYSLLYKWKTLPGSLEDGTVNEPELKDWVKKARERCEETGHLEVCDVHIGDVFAKSPHEEKDGSWPCIPVRNVIEEISSDDLVKGFEIGIFNKRGTTSRSLFEGGIQERELARKYREYAEACDIGWPKTAAVLRKLVKNYEDQALREDERTKDWI